MSIVVVGVRIIVDKIVLVDDTICHTIAVRIGPEEGMVDIDAGIENDGRITTSVNSVEPRVGPKVIDIDQGPGFVDQRLSGRAVGRTKHQTQLVICHREIRRRCRIRHGRRIGPGCRGRRSFLRAARRTCQRHRELFVGLNIRVAGYRNRNDLRRLSRCERHRAERQCTTEVLGVRRVGAAASDRIIDSQKRAGVAGSRNQKGEIRGPAIAFLLFRVQGFNRQQRQIDYLD